MATRKEKSREARVENILDTLEFLYQEVYDTDDITVRAMIVYGGTDDQIVRALTISAVQTSVSRDDKSRYAFGCLKNLMMEGEAA